MDCIYEDKPITSNFSISFDEEYAFKKIMGMIQIEGAEKAED